MARYTYGDSDLAAERLALVARTFEPASSGFLHAVAPYAPALAVDLGCGPGHTTRMVHEVAGGTRTVGLDASAPHVARAAVEATPGITFAVHDVTRTPLPTGPADLLYARLLLAHLADTGSHVAGWAAELRAGGVLALDDMEGIDADDDVVVRYLEEVALAVIRRHGGALFVGAALHELADPPGTVRIHDEVATFAPPAATTARIFGMNLAVLTARGEVTPRPDLEAGLAAIESGERNVEPVVWRMRHVAFRSRSADTRP